MSGVGSLRVFRGLFGADEVITNYRPDLNEWVATLMLKGENMEEVRDKKERTYGNIRDNTSRADVSDADRLLGRRR